jgi:hypothetical protein
MGIAAEKSDLANRLPLVSANTKVLNSGLFNLMVPAIFCVTRLKTALWSMTLGIKHLCASEWQANLIRDDCSGIRHQFLEETTMFFFIHDRGRTRSNRTLGISGGAWRRPLHAVVSPRPSLGRREVCRYHVLAPELISAFNAPGHPARRAKEAQ